MARVRVEIYQHEVQALRAAPGTRYEINRAAKGMAHRAKVYAADRFETGRLVASLDSFPSPSGDPASRAVSWSHEAYYGMFQNKGWHERHHTIPGDHFLDMAYKTYSLL